MSAVELRVSTGRAVRVDRNEVAGRILRGGSVPRAIGAWLAARAGRANIVAASVRGNLVTLELPTCANGPRVAKGLGLTAAAPRQDARVWVGSVFGCKVVAHQPLACDRSA